MPTRSICPRAWRPKASFCTRRFGSSLRSRCGKELAGLPAFRHFGGETASPKAGACTRNRSAATSASPIVSILWSPRRRDLARRPTCRRYRPARERLDPRTGDRADAQHLGHQAETNATASKSNASIAMPGQARLQDRRTQAQGIAPARDEGTRRPRDPREFHRAVLEDGSLPLDVLDAKVTRWLDARLAR